MATLDADDLDAIAEAVYLKLKDASPPIRVHLDQSQPVDVTIPAQGDTGSVGQALAACLYECYGDIDQDRSSGEVLKTHPGRPAVAFGTDDTDEGKFRHRKYL